VVSVARFLKGSAIRDNSIAVFADGRCSVVGEFFQYDGGDALVKVVGFVLHDSSTEPPLYECSYYGFCLYFSYL